VSSPGNAGTPIPARGTFHDGRSASARPATLTLADGNFLLDDEPFATLDDAEIEPRVGALPRTVSFRDGSSFVTPDQEAADAWLVQRKGHAARRLHVLENHLPSVLALTLLTVLTVGGVLLWGVPAAARAVAFALPEGTMAQLGRDVLAQLDERGVFEPSALPAGTRSRLRETFREHTRRLGIATAPRLVFRSGMRNALALPDGTIVLFDELIAFAGDDAAVQGVLLHELGHVEERHALRKLLEASAGSLLVIFVTGDLSGATALLGSLPVAYAQLSHSRGFEREADAFAARALETLDLPAEPLAGFLERLAEEEGSTGGLLSTHPGASERAATLRAGDGDG
jgi:Zn-dependent protease with chaperone function